MVDENVLTVNDLLDLCTRLFQNGYGNMPVKCQDAYLHKNEITTNLIGEGCMLFRGYLFHQDFTKKMQEFQQDIDNAVKKFYGYTNK